MSNLTILIFLPFKLRFMRQYNKFCKKSLKEPQCNKLKISKHMHYLKNLKKDNYYKRKTLIALKHILAYDFVHVSLSSVCGFV
jgi:hypothetical protein